MNTLLRCICITFLLLAGLPGVAQEPPPDPVLHLELGTMTTDSAPDEQHVLMLELTLEAEPEELPASGQAMAEQCPPKTLILELKLLAVDEYSESLTSLSGDATDQAGEGPSPILVLELNTMLEDMPADTPTGESLTARLAENPAMLLLELEPMSGDALSQLSEERWAEEGFWDKETTLVLELDTIAPDNFAGGPDTLLLQLEALQGGAAFRQISDFSSQLLASYAPSLIGHWRLIEGEGQTAWDYSDNLNDGTIHNLYWTSDGLQFQDGYIEVPEDLSLDAEEALTMTAWVYLDDVAASQRIFGKLAPSQQLGYLLEMQPYLAGFQNLSGLMVEAQKGGLTPIIYDEDRNSDTDLWETIPAKSWTHLAVTWERGGDMIGYVNGVEVGRAVASDTPIGSGNKNPLFIGAAPFDLQDSAETHGVLADLRLYDVPLSAAAIKTLVTGWGTTSPQEEGSDGTGGADGAGGTGSGGGALLPSQVDLALEGDNPEFEITEDVLNSLTAEGVDQKIVDVLRTFQDQRFQGTANNQYVLITAVRDVLFETSLKDPLQNLPKNKDGSFTITKGFLDELDIPADLKTALRKLQGTSYSTPEKLVNAVKMQVKKVVQNTVRKHLVKHARVQQEFMITDALLNKLNPDARDKLNDLKHKRYLSEEAFKKAVDEKLGAGGFEQQQDLLNNAEVQNEFVVTDDVLAVWPADLRNGLWTLKEHRFLNETDFEETVKTQLLMEYADALKAAERDDGKFVVTDQLLEDWEDWDELPETLRKSLNVLKNQEFADKDAFDNAVKAKFGESVFAAYQDQVLTAASKKAFVIDNQTLKQMEQAGISEDARKKLKKLKGRTFPDDVKFTEAAKAEIGAVNFSDAVKSKVIQHAKVDYNMKSQRASRSSSSRESQIKRNRRRGKKKKNL